MKYKYRAEVPHRMVYPTLGITVDHGDEVELDIEPDKDKPIAGLVPVDGYPQDEETAPTKGRSTKKDADGPATGTQE